VLRLGTENRIRGIEQEYPVSMKVGLNPTVLVNAAIQGLKRVRFTRDVKWDVTMEISQEAHESKTVSFYGDNGSRIYNDLGHLEIATPSYNNPFDAVAYDKASEIYAFVGSREASLALKKSVTVHKNNVANFFSPTEGWKAKGKGKEGKIKTNIYATHGNILTKREACKDWSRVEKALIPWVVTRILFTGSGDVVSGDMFGQGGVKFVISPRAMFVVQKSSLSTTSGRGILNTRDQPHAARRYWRLHDINYEALRSEYAIFLRDIVQAQVTSAFELGLLDDAPVIDDPVKAFRELSLDTQECAWKIKLRNGETTDAVSILRFYLNAIEDIYENQSEELGKWEEIGLTGFKDVIDNLEARRVERYVDGIDWVTKLALLVNYEPKTAYEGISICNQYALLDESVLYYSIGGKEHVKTGCLFDPEDSLAFARKSLPEVDWSALSGRIKYALSNAPEQTREFFRAAMLKRYGSHVKCISWSTLILDKAKIFLDEPFMLNKEEISMEGGLEEILGTAKKLYPRKVIF
jgi:hypothetical protein